MEKELPNSVAFDPVEVKLLDFGSNDEPVLEEGYSLGKRLVAVGCNGVEHGVAEVVVVVLETREMLDGGIQVLSRTHFGVNEDGLRPLSHPTPTGSAPPEPPPTRNSGNDPNLNNYQPSHAHQMGPNRTSAVGPNQVGIPRPSSTPVPGLDPTPRTGPGSAANLTARGMDAVWRATSTISNARKPSGM